MSFEVPTGYAVVRGRMPDGRWLNHGVPYVLVDGCPSAAPVDEARRLAREGLDARLAECIEVERRTGRYVCCGGSTSTARHAEACSAAWPDGTPR